MSATRDNHYVPEWHQVISPLQGFAQLLSSPFKGIAIG
jgi:hypothetical protein